MRIVIFVELLHCLELVVFVVAEYGAMWADHRQVSCADYF